MSTKITGLTASEVLQRQQQGLTNNFHPHKVKSLSEIIVSNTLNIFNLVNSAVFVVLTFFYFRSGDIRLLWDSLGLFTVTIINTLVAILQELKAAAALKKIELIKDESLFVVRDGEKIEITKYEIVKDDVVVLKLGDQIIVDGTLILTNRLEIDESLITGESIPLLKVENDKVTSGSFCISGNGLYTADIIGENTFAAKITKSARKFEIKVSPLQKRINFLFTASFAIAIFLVIVLIIINLTSAQGFTIDKIREISTVAIALIPEGLVFFSTLTFMISILRLAKKGAIIQKVNAIDSFADVKIACFDKTGTLTKNHITVAKITSASLEYDNAEIEKLLGTYGALSDDSNATVTALKKFVPVDGCKLIDSIPFNSEHKFSVQQILVNGIERIFILGALDIISNQIGENQKLSESVYKEIKGFRNLLFGEITSPIPLAYFNEYCYSITPICIVSLKDEVRAETKPFIDFLLSRNVAVKYLTGDSPDAMLKVLEEIGVDTTNLNIVLGKDINLNDEQSLKNLILDNSVFARLIPEQKHALVKAARHSGNHTSFCGDGVNDLPALKNADLSISFASGSAASKEVADIVLTHNDLNVLRTMYYEGNKVNNSVSYVAKLYLTKIFIVIMLTALSWFNFIIFPLTPRVSSLIGVLSISLPVYLISLKNKNTAPHKKFLKNIYIFTAISGIFIMSVLVATYHFIVPELNIAIEETKTLLVAILIVMSIINYATVVIFEDSVNTKPYITYGLILLGVYFFFATVPNGFLLTDFLKRFYEIAQLDQKTLVVSLGIALPASLLLIFVQYLRHKFINDNTGESN